MGGMQPHQKALKDSLASLQKLSKIVTKETDGGDIKNLLKEECLNRWQSNGCRGMVQAVTGSGKTFLALTAADRLLTYGSQSGRLLHAVGVYPAP